PRPRPRPRPPDRIDPQLHLLLPPPRPALEHQRHLPEARGERSRQQRPVGPAGRLVDPDGPQLPQPRRLPRPRRRSEQGARDAVAVGVLAGPLTPTVIPSTPQTLTGVRSLSPIHPHPPFVDNLRCIEAFA